MNATVQTAQNGLCPLTTSAFNCRGLTKFGYFSAREASAYGAAHIFVSPLGAIQKRNRLKCQGSHRIGCAFLLSRYIPSDA